MSEKPHPDQVLEWLHQGTLLAMTRTNRKVTHRQIVWCLIERAVQVSCSSGERPLWVTSVLSWLSYCSGRFRHSKWKQALFGIASGVDREAIRSMMKMPVGSDDAFDTFKRRVADCIIDGLKRDYGIVPCPDRASFCRS